MDAIDLERHVTKQLASCDSIIRQHKKSCLRITCLMVTSNYLWAGTSAGVVVNIGKCSKRSLNKLSVFVPARYTG
jgi:hypothetical protein